MPPPDPPQPPAVPTSAPAPRALSRRGLLAGGAGLLALTGCSSVHVPGTSARPAPPSPDVVVVGEAVTALTSALALLRRTARRWPALAPLLAPLRTAHAAHRAALVTALPARSTVSPAPPAVAPAASRPAARAAVVTSEEALVARLRALAMRSQSGELARLLGSVAASVEQHLVTVRG